MAPLVRAWGAGSARSQIVLRAALCQGLCQLSSRRSNNTPMTRTQEHHRELDLSLEEAARDSLFGGGRGECLLVWGEIPPNPNVGRAKNLTPLWWPPPPSQVCWGGAPSPEPDTWGGQVDEPRARRCRGPAVAAPVSGFGSATRVVRTLRAPSRTNLRGPRSVSAEREHSEGTSYSNR